MFPLCVQNIHHNVSRHWTANIFSCNKTFIAVLNRKGKSEAQWKWLECQRTVKGQHVREERDTVDRRKVFFEERSDFLISPNWIYVIINMLFVCMSVYGRRQRERGHPLLHAKACMVTICMYAEIWVCVCQNSSPPPKPFLQALLQPFSHTEILSTPQTAEKVQELKLWSVRRECDGDRLRDDNGTFTISFTTAANIRIRRGKCHVYKTSYTFTAHSLMAGY